MKRFLLAILLGAWCSLSAQADEAKLPFDRAQINRYSLDHLSRSISIRQGDDFWLGYDLQRGTLYKAWQAPEGKAALKASGFVMKSVGKTLYEDKSDATWKLQTGDRTAALTVRYLGCSQRDEHFELRWELKHDSTIITLRERVPMDAAQPIVRQLQVESLPDGAQLFPPKPVLAGWTLTSTKGQVSSHLSSPQWYQLHSR